MSIINSLLSVVSGTKAVVVYVLAILALGSLSYALYEKSESLQTTLDYEIAQKASIEANLESSSEYIVKLNNQIKASKIASQEFSEANKVITNKYIELEAKYNDFLGRDYIIQKKPTLVNKKMNSAFNIFVDEVSCNSGVETSCIKD